MPREWHGIAHIILTVSRFEECQAFYKELLPFLGLQLVFDGEDICYHVGARTGIGLQQYAPEHRDERFVRTRTGLHHCCLRARFRQDVDQVYDLLQGLNAAIATPPQEAPWAPGCHSVLFEDPDGIRVEVNDVPGKEVLAKEVV